MPESAAAAGAWHQQGQSVRGLHYKNKPSMSPNPSSSLTSSLVAHLQSQEVMSANIRPLKRARVEDRDRSESMSNSQAIPLQSEQLKRHEELWFDDGNLVLVARDTAFRIYRGLIASQSTVFSDMLVSSCASADETFEGCPTVQLSDSPEDLAHFLRVLLPGSQKR